MVGDLPGISSLSSHLQPWWFASFSCFDQLIIFSWNGQQIEMATKTTTQERMPLKRDLKHIKTCHQECLLCEEFWMKAFINPTIGPTMTNLLRFFLPTSIGTWNHQLPWFGATPQQNWVQMQQHWRNSMSHNTRNEFQVSATFKQFVEVIWFRTFSNTGEFGDKSFSSFWMFFSSIRGLSFSWPHSRTKPCVDD